MSADDQKYFEDQWNGIIAQNGGYASGMSAAIAQNQREQAEWFAPTPVTTGGSSGGYGGSYSGGGGLDLPTSSTTDTLTTTGYGGGYTRKPGFFEAAQEFAEEGIDRTFGAVHRALTWVPGWCWVVLKLSLALAAGLSALAFGAPWLGCLIAAFGGYFALSIVEGCCQGLLAGTLALGFVAFWVAVGFLFVAAGLGLAFVVLSLFAGG